MTYCEDLGASMEDFIDDESTLVPDDHTERTLLPDSELVTPPSCSFLRLPLDIRKRIYRYFCLSHIGCTSHPRLWAPPQRKGGWRKIGYFERDTVLPILLTCWQVHNEATSILYGENVFAFHISVISRGPIIFFQWLAPRYVRLLRKVYIRTGFNVDTYDLDYDKVACRRHGRHHPSALAELQVAQDLLVSTALIKQAWPSLFGVKVNTTTVLWCSRQDDWAMWTKADVNDWPIAAFHLWKMVVSEDDSEDFRPEFRRVQWVEELATRNTNPTV